MKEICLSFAICIVACFFFSDFKLIAQEVVGPPPAAGIRPGRCNLYAAIAVAQNRANLLNKCGFTGGRWNSNHDYHYNWCASVPPEASRPETQERQTKLDQCLDLKGSCNLYADIAVSQSQANLSNKCGLTGDRWNSNHDYHYKWCVDASLKASRQETQERQIKLDQCLQ